MKKLILTLILGVSAILLFGSQQAYAVTNVGYTSIGASTQGSSNRLRVSRITVPTGGAGSVSQGNMYIDGATADATVYMIAYSGSGTNAPTSLLGVSNGVSVLSTASPAWINFTFATPFNVTVGQDIWIGLYADIAGTTAGTAGPLIYYSGSVIGNYASDGYRYASLGNAPVPDPFPAHTDTSTQLSYSAYLVVSDGTYAANGTGATGSVQTFTAPSTGKYTILAKGAVGGINTSYAVTGGAGASIQGDFYLTAGEVLNVMVGQAGGNGTGGGGGGGSFVVKSTGTIPLVVAGGGGGAHQSNGGPGLATNNGTSNGGTGYSYGTGGAGFQTNGTIGGSAGGTGITASLSYVNGGTGGATNTSGTAIGGYGGGGGAHSGCGGGCGSGGGGGYNGGNAQVYYGDGGGSFNAGINQTNTQGANAAAGSVVITYIGGTAGPLVISPTKASITAAGATLGGNVTSDGGSAVTGRGVCVATSVNPTTGCTSTTGTTGVFTVGVGSLSQNTVYYYRAYATNANGTTYSPNDTFTTLTLTVPTINTPTKTSISYTSATLGGNVASDGGAAVTGRGVCIGASANPAIGGTCFTTTGTTGVFTISATPLTQNTPYHYRAYATNSQGTSYTTDGTFTTLSQLATVTTSAPSGLDTTSVNFVMSANPNNFGASTGYFRYAAGASVACDGSAGTRWPTAGGIAIPDGAGAQTYTQTTSPTLNPGTQYAYCAYDLNTYGTASAASSQNFTTPSWTAGCAAPTTGNLTVSSSCYFSNSNDGVDAGGSTASTVGNTATLTVPSGKTLNVGTAVPNQKIAFGVLSKPVGGVIARALGAQLMRAPVWILDTDGDGYPDAANPVGVVSATRPGATYARRSFINTNIASADCNTSNANVFQNVANLATDGDNDGYISGSSFGTQCVGGSSVVNGRTNYKNTSGTYTWLPSGSQLGTSDCNDSNASVYRNGYTDSDGDTYATSASPTCIGSSTTGYSLSPSGYSDCNDANANVFQNVSVANDADHEGYATSTASSQCVGTTSSINGRTYYKNTSAQYNWLPSGSQLGTSDCCDSDALAYPSSSTCKSNTNACGSYDYNCTGTSTSDCSVGTYSLAPGTANQASTSCIYSGSCGAAANGSCGLGGYYYACH